MSLGGGTFTTQNKTLPGTYVNFVSAQSVSSAVSERGICAAALSLDWGEEGKIISLSAIDAPRRALALFGREYTHPSLWKVRDIFKNAKTLLYCRINGGEKASCALCEARYSGVRGNDLRVVVAGGAPYTVSLYLDGEKVDTQSVESATELVDNDFVIWNADATLAVSAGIHLTGGTNGADDGYSDFLTLCESESFNTLAVASQDAAVNTMAAQFTRRMRDDCGVKFQCVLYNTPFDYYGVVNVKNSPDLVYWAAGALAGCAVNRSCQNKLYDGEGEIEASYTQSQLADAIADGEWTLHRVGSALRVLADVNSLTTLTDTISEAFRENQTVRVIDQIANDDALLFASKYLGLVPNDTSGRASLWGDIVSHREKLASIRAIEDFKEDDVSVEEGETKKSVVVTSRISVTNSMSVIYVTTTLM